MGYYRKNKRKKYYDDYEIDIEGIICFTILGLIFSIINFIMKNYKIIILISITIAFATVIIYAVKNVKPMKKNKIEKKLKQLDLYKNIITLNNKYNFESLEIFYDQYQVAYKSNLKTCNIDDYLLMTIDKKYDELKKYKMKYDRLNKEYQEYKKEYENLKKYINIEEAKKIKLKEEVYLKNQWKIYNENKQKPDIDFKVVIYINYKSPKGNVKEKKYKRYEKEKFSKIINEYLELKKQNKLLEISSRIERAKMSESLRYDVLKRDKFKCQICGMTAQDGVKLQVDHIIPVSKGGKTEINNLQTLCSRCNIGKGNKI